MNFKESKVRKMCCEYYVQEFRVSAFRHTQRWGRREGSRTHECVNDRSTVPNP
jgi:hypothetical protein